jgi:hypothetical protein
MGALPFELSVACMYAKSPRIQEKVCLNSISNHAALVSCKYVGMHAHKIACVFSVLRKQSLAGATSSEEHIHHTFSTFKLLAWDLSMSPSVPYWCEINEQCLGVWWPIRPPRYHPMLPIFFYPFLNHQQMP